MKRLDSGKAVPIAGLTAEGCWAALPAARGASASPCPPHLRSHVSLPTVAMGQSSLFLSLSHGARGPRHSSPPVKSFLRPLQMDTDSSASSTSSCGIPSKSLVHKTRGQGLCPLCLVLFRFLFFQLQLTFNVIFVSGVQYSG